MYNNGRDHETPRIEFEFRLPEKEASRNTKKACLPQALTYAR